MVVLVAPVQTRQAGVNTNSRDESSPGTPFGRALGWTSSLESVSAPVDSFGHCATPLSLVWFLKETWQWGSRLVHENFRRVLKSSDEYVQFLRGLEAQVGNIFRAAVSGPTTRAEVAAILRSSLGRLVELKEFHVQVLMRTIEMCLHEPFGAVDVVAPGHGSSDAAQQFVEQWPGGEARAGSGPAAGRMSRLIVEHFNSQGKRWADGDLPAQESVQFERMVCVLGLEWSRDLACLIHSGGIGKRYDASDAEHGLCVIYTLFQATLPARTVSSTYALDRDKYFPVRVNSGKVAAKDLPVMRSFIEQSKKGLQVYQEVLADDGDSRRCVPGIFRIDGERRADSHGDVDDNMEPTLCLDTEGCGNGDVDGVAFEDAPVNSFPPAPLVTEGQDPTINAEAWAANGVHTGAPNISPEELAKENSLRTAEGEDAVSYTHLRAHETRR